MSFMVRSIFPQELSTFKDNDFVVLKPAAPRLWSVNAGDCGKFLRGGTFLALERR